MTVSEWWCGAVIYQIYPRSFLDSDSDGVGDLRGITMRLDHIASQGVDAIWLYPFFISPQRDFGYDVADYPRSIRCSARLRISTRCWLGLTRWG